MSTILIKNGHVIDPKNGVDAPMDVLVENGKISKLGKTLSDKVDNVIDAKGLTVTPGLIDLQVHVREPGREDKETIETASKAALSGGITSIVAMPNTNPAADNQSIIEFVINKSQQLRLINIYSAGSTTKGQKGESLSEINEMIDSGAIAITDDGYDVQNETLLRRALEYARTCDVLVMSHCENDTLTDGGVMHEGWVSTQLGLPGVSTAAEDMGVLKNILLAELTGARLHLLHNASKGAVDAIRAAKAKGARNITAEVSVQHFALTDEECIGYNTNAKMYPPLRSRDHVDAIIEAIKDDTIDAFTTDHAPHTEPEKLEPFELAAYGSTGLETSFAVMNTYLVQAEHITLNKGISKMTVEPAQIIRKDKGHLSVGADADIAIFDTNHEWRVDSYQHSFSKGKNCVFNGKTLTGKCVHTIVDGELRYSHGKIIK